MSFLSRCQLKLVIVNISFFVLFYWLLHVSKLALIRALTVTISQHVNRQQGDRWPHIGIATNDKVHYRTSAEILHNTSSRYSHSLWFESSYKHINFFALLSSPYFIRNHIGPYWQYEDIHLSLSIYLILIRYCYCTASIVSLLLTHKCADVNTLLWFEQNVLLLIESTAVNSFHSHQHISLCNSWVTHLLTWKKEREWRQNLKYWLQEGPHVSWSSFFLNMFVNNIRCLHLV